MNLREWRRYAGDMQGNEPGEVWNVIFLWYFLSNRKFGMELTAGMGSVQLLLFRSINVLEKDARGTEHSK